MRILSNKLSNFLKKSVTVEGWVNSRRDHGGLIFIDLRDHTGIIQLVVTPEKSKSFELAESIRDEFVLRATGTIRERDADLINPNIETGKIELVVDELTILNKSLTPTINTHDDGEKSSEELRLKYRFLDLRRPSMQKILRRRSEFVRFLRNYMYDHGFTEVSTPILANSSPEGARDFLVPSRLHPGKFYALPQAPQQFKQLLMVGGIDKYFQIAPCFRDEDPRADRLYGDFYQLDMEMAFVEDGEVVRSEIEPLYRSLVTEFANKKIVLNSPVAKKYLIEGHPLIPRIPYKDAMEYYGVDKPDLRYGMEMIDLTDTFANTDFKVFKTECVKALLVKGGANLTRSQIDNFTDKAKKLGAGGLAYILYQNGEAKSPILKFMTESEISAVQKLTGAKDGDAVFFGADERDKVNKVLGQLRIAFADHFNLKDDNTVALCWIIDFPFYEWDDKNHKLDFGHNPFSMPKGGLEALEKALSDFRDLPRPTGSGLSEARPVTTEQRSERISNSFDIPNEEVRSSKRMTGASERVEKTESDFSSLLAIVADQYDMVMNGLECCSGAVRNYNPEIMYKVFNILGYNNEYVEKRFGGMLNAFKFGAPPHAGCAPGIDRIFMVLEGIENIRDIVAFPKNGNGVDLMMDSPSTVDQIQLDESHLAIIEDEK